ncbi:tetratricopeptide repeat protein [Neorhizobium sp. P12A]|uniref:tetratricopeptide repeat protein n=1 Tax=Neorhizobium sp. P12A TaxID=2268027 RepID=UPI0011ED72B0|nr:tetratricopeptide repeat protein [Neorhizobium sp. P12A]KAA0692521.1 tetratricopeptide repeat protein [Neorhizobium sp. P12A]
MSTIENNDDSLAARKSLNEAMSSHVSGDLPTAEKHYVQVLNRDYRTEDILPLLAGIVAKRGDYELALYYWDSLLTLKPGHLVGLLEKGGILHKRGQLADAIACYKLALSVSPGNPLILNNLAVTMSDAGRRDEALEMFHQVLRLQPDNIDVRHQIRRLSSAIVPFWHIAMMNDQPRNDAFEAAIKRAIEMRGAEAQILDIGSGSGLLSMMAARAGARNIATCEAVPVIAKTAAEIIADNGFEDRISVAAKTSQDLVIGKDMESRADILISEILSSDLLAEHVIATFEDAHSRLLSDDAIIIPRAATALGCLVASDTLAEYAHVQTASGFDVSRFNALAPNRLPLHGTMTGWTRLSDDFELVSIDLTQPKHAAASRKIRLPVSVSGRATGIVQWMHIDLIDDITFSNHPDDYHDGGWLQVLHTFPKPVEVIAGQTIELVVGHDRSSLIVMPA